MPVVARQLGGVREYGLAFSLFYTTALLGTSLAGGWADRRGPREPVLTGLALFVVGLALCGSATSWSVLLLGRAVSGAGGGLIGVALYVVVADSYPPATRPVLFGWISAAWVVPSMVGPAVAGLLAEHASWRLVFWLVPPLVTGPALVLLPRLRRPNGGGADGGGADGGGAGGGGPGRREQTGGGARALRGAGLAAGVLGVQIGLQAVVARPGPLGLLVLGGGLALALVSLPGLVPAGTALAVRGLPSVVLVRGLLTAAFFGAETFVPLMLVSERRLSAAVAGLCLTGGAVGWSSGAWLQGRRGLRLSRFTLVSAGAAVIAVAVLGLTGAVTDTFPVWLVAPLWAFSGLGMGLAMSCTSVLTLQLSPAGQEGRSSAGLQLSDQLGSVLGLGVLGAVFGALHDPAGSDAGAFRLIWVITGSLAVVTAGVAVRTRPAGPASVGKPADGSLSTS